MSGDEVLNVLNRQFHVTEANRACAMRKRKFSNFSMVR